MSIHGEFDKKLTGRHRFRVLRTGGLFKRKGYKLVLQVEYRYTHVHNLYGYIEAEARSTWRDAQLEDVTILNLPSVAQTVS